jgi:methylated-DNA-[protein]-cysteine S-methyltransferase
MTAVSFAIFETKIGACGIAWGDRGIAAVQLPEASEQKTRARLQRRFPEAREAPPPPDVQHAVDGITALLRGEASDLSAIALDMNDLPAFNRRVYEVARAIPPGATLSYGEIAARLGEPPQAARDVGQALGQNPIPIIVPCHRVLAANGKPGGFSASGGVTTKLRLLTIEGAKTSDEPSLFQSLPLATRPRRR